MSAKEAARYAFDGGRPPSILPIKSRVARGTANLKPPAVGSQRRWSASSLSLSPSISHIESFDSPSYFERIDHQLQAEIWKIMNQCWRPEPEDRPAIDDVQEAIRSIFSTIGAEGEDYDTFGDKPTEVESAEYVTYNQISMSTLGSSRFTYEKNKCHGSSKTRSDQSKGLNVDTYSSMGRNSGSELSYGHS